MTTHEIGTREQWLTARLELLEAEKELTRRSDELARRRQELPWVRVDKEYRFETDEGSASLADLFRGRSQLLVYHFMFGPDYTAGCPSCSAIADGFDGFVVHLANHDVMLWAVSRAPLAKLQAYKQRMGWTFPWASSLGSDFNFDFNVSVTEEQQRAGAVEYNYRRAAARPVAEIPSRATPEGAAKGAAMTGTDVATYARERPGMSAFVLEDGVVYHTYSTYARGLDGLWGAYQWLDRAPKGRNETGYWWHLHDEYDKRWSEVVGGAGRGRGVPGARRKKLGASVVLSVARHWATIDAGISAGGRHRQPAEVMRPTLGVAGALRRVGKSAMGHAQQACRRPARSGRSRPGSIPAAPRRRPPSRSCRRGDGPARPRGTRRAPCGGSPPSL